MLHGEIRNLPPSSRSALHRRTSLLVSATRSIVDSQTEPAPRRAHGAAVAARPGDRASSGTATYSVAQESASPPGVASDDRLSAPTPPGCSVREASDLFSYDFLQDVPGPASGPRRLASTSDSRRVATAA